MIPKKCKGKTLSHRPVHEIEGWFCQVQGKAYIILDNAELLDFDCMSTFSSHGDSIAGFLEVNPDTVELLEAHDE